MNQKGPFLIAASYDLTISVTDLSTDASAVAAPLKFGLQNAQANRIIGLSGSRFAVASNPFIFVYDRTAKTNKPHQTFQGHQTNVLDLCTDGTHLYSCSEDESWRVWDFTQLRPTAVYQTGSCLNAICLMRDNSVIVTGNDRDQVEVWNVSDGKKICDLKLGQSTIRSIAPIGKDGLAAVGCLDGTAVIVRVGESEVTEVRRVQAHTEPITHVAASPDGKYFATASADSTAKLWHVETGELKVTLEDQVQTRWVWDVAFTPDSKFVCTGGTDKVCRIWDVETGALQRSVEWHQKGVTCIAIIQ